MMTQDEARVVRFIETWDLSDSLINDTQNVFLQGYGSADFRALWELFYHELVTVSNYTNMPSVDDIAQRLNLEPVQTFGWFGIYEGLDTIAENTLGYNQV